MFAYLPVPVDRNSVFSGPQLEKLYFALAYNTLATSGKNYQLDVIPNKNTYSGKYIFQFFQSID